MVKVGLNFFLILWLILQSTKADSDCDPQDGIQYDKIESKKH